MFSVFLVLLTIMAQTGTINDLLNKNSLDNSEEEDGFAYKFWSQESAI